MNSETHVIPLPEITNGDYLKGDIAICFLNGYFYSELRVVGTGLGKPCHCFHSSMKCGERVQLRPEHAQYFILSCEPKNQTNGQD